MSPQNPKDNELSLKPSSSATPGPDFSDVQGHVDTVPAAGRSPEFADVQGHTDTVPAGAGQTYTLNSFGFAFYRTSPAHLYFYGNDIWFGDFQAMPGLSRFQKGYYPDAMRSSQSAQAASMGIFRIFAPACNLVTGWFAVDSVVYASNGDLSLLRLRFEQHCEGIGPALHGVIGYHFP